ncbi:hypothetical protein [Sarcina ventriculi]|uniref:hypothetical protein n=1 Tax=Sarcina ventriculi TaxID=1267 RepID=UPI001C10DFEF|nr:hypothetical protein [Sarcina ventriculi]MBU5322862.1 hypothetical protein [Sarcina ventriculi]MDO4401522.1 hypothetical protein [Clostridiaceae bacterium]
MDKTNIILLIVILLIVFVYNLITIDRFMKEINNNLLDIKLREKEESLKSKSKLEKNVIDIKDNKETVNLKIKIKGR